MFSEFRFFPVPQQYRDFCGEPAKFSPEVRGQAVRLGSDRVRAAGSRETAVGTYRRTWMEKHGNSLRGVFDAAQEEIYLLMERDALVRFRRALRLAHDASMAACTQALLRCTGVLPGAAGAGGWSAAGAAVALSPARGAVWSISCRRLFPRGRRTLGFDLFAMSSSQRQRRGSS